jgi:hypothetical protein
MMDPYCHGNQIQSHVETANRKEKPPQMNEAFRSLLDYLADNWPEIVWIIAAAGLASYFAGYRARKSWQRLEFWDRLNVSLTSIDHGKLRIRTILEMDCQRIFLNPTAAKNIVKFAKQTTLENPILPIPPDDCWQYLNAVLNEISERFAPGQIRRDLGLPVEQGEYVICLTCERAGPVRTRKVRAMLVQKCLLKSLPEEEPSYESPNHQTRWQTLQYLAQEYQRNPHRFMEMEICV